MLEGVRVGAIDARLPRQHVLCAPHVQDSKEPTRRLFHRVHAKNQATRGHHVHDLDGLPVGDRDVHDSAVERGQEAAAGYGEAAEQGPVLRIGHLEQHHGGRDEDAGGRAGQESAENGEYEYCLGEDQCYAGKRERKIPMHSTGRRPILSAAIPATGGATTPPNM
ncbi:hypothetical protein V5799_032985 [Amblyomma americanum]|uniref:Uncharacterized protein n=1 Tax=Amblyomma americanum TaxID=6943 RepID=A0AAQ4DPL7_AMBAM